MKIALLGDIGLFGKFDLANNNLVKEYFADVAEFLRNFDYVVGNLETPFTLNTRTIVSKSAHLKSNPINIELLKLLNVKAVNLANNHIFDYGTSAYKSTIAVLKENGVKYFGTNNEQFYLEDEKIAFSGFCCYSTNAFGYYTKLSKNGVNILDGKNFKETLIKNNDKGYLNIASVHFGDEHVYLPRIEHLKLARDVAESIPYIFYGHHPHVIQGIEKRKKSLLAYSLGNFCFDDIYVKNSKKLKVKQSHANKESFILSLEIEENKLKNYQTIPIFDNGSQIIVNPDNSKILEKLNSFSKNLTLNTKDYKQLRKEKLNDLYSTKKRKRNISWYFERVNFNMLGTKIKGRYFKLKYKKHLKNYL